MQIKKKHQSSASLAFATAIHRGPMNSPHKGPVTRKMFPLDDVIMEKSFRWPNSGSDSCIDHYSIWCAPCINFTILRNLHSQHLLCSDPYKHIVKGCWSRVWLQSFLSYSVCISKCFIDEMIILLLLLNARSSLFCWIPHSVSDCVNYFQLLLIAIYCISFVTCFTVRPGFVEQQQRNHQS